MEDNNISIIVSLIIGLVSLAAYMYVSSKQAVETYIIRNSDKLLQLRLILLFTLTITIVGIVPALIYQWLRLQGVDSEAMRNFANICAQISRLSTAVALVLIYNYRKEE